jgi:cell wall assembly regulator SMI1
MTDDIWDRFESMLSVHAPQLLATLEPPASEAQIAEAEAAMGVRLPDEVRHAYLRHDGTLHGDLDEPSSLFVPFNWWACLDDVVDNWRMKVEVSNSLRAKGDPGDLFPTYASWWEDLKVCPVWWNQKWIPIGLSGTATSAYIDLDPAPKGTVGQLILDGGMQEARWIANGFNHYLELLIDRVERGLLIFRDGWVWTETDETVFDWHRFA